MASIEYGSTEYHISGDAHGCGVVMGSAIKLNKSKNCCCCIVIKEITLWWLQFGNFEEAVYSLKRRQQKVLYNISILLSPIMRYIQYNTVDILSLSPVRKNTLLVFLVIWSHKKRAPGKAGISFPERINDSHSIDDSFSFLGVKHIRNSVLLLKWNSKRNRNKNMDTDNFNKKQKHLKSAIHMHVEPRTNAFHFHSEMDRNLCFHFILEIPEH